MPFLVRRIRHALAKTPLRQAVLWYRDRNWSEKDAFLVEYPKSGITWLRFLVYETLTGKASTWVEVNRAIIYRAYAAPLLPDGGRVIPTHEPYRKEYHRVVYIARDVRDVVLSEYAYETALGLFRGDLDAFIGAFLKGSVNGYGAWHKHVASWLDAAAAGKVKLLLVRYEDMRANPETKVAEIMDFLGVPAGTEVIRDAVRNNSLEQMRAKEDTARTVTTASGKAPLRKMVGGASEGNRFVREGKVAGWRGKLRDDQVRLIEQHTSAELLRLGYPLSADLAAREAAARTAP